MSTNVWEDPLSNEIKPEKLILLRKFQLGARTASRKSNLPIKLYNVIKSHDEIPSLS